VSTLAHRAFRRPVPAGETGELAIAGSQLTLGFWFYHYIPWFLPFVFVALLARGPHSERKSADSL